MALPNTILSKIMNFTGVVPFDIETSGLDPHKDRILLIQFTLDEPFVVEVAKEDSTLLSKVIAALSAKTVVGHDIKFDIKFIYANFGIVLQHVWDTLIGEQIITNGIKDKYPSLADVVEKYTGVHLDKSVRASFYTGGVIGERELEYAKNDVLYLRDVYNAQLEEINRSKQQRVAELEMQVVPIVAMMEYVGTKFDRDTIIAAGMMSQEDAKRSIEDAKDVIFSAIQESPYNVKFWRGIVPLAKKEITMLLMMPKDSAMAFLRSKINLASPQQKVAILRALGLDVDSADKKTLGKIDHPLVRHLLDFSKANKDATTYGTNILGFINPATGRVHTEFHQYGARSGRFSSSNVNLQNLPPEYRKAAVPADGFVFIVADYSQQELRIATSVSREPVLLEAYKNGVDVHALTASLLFNKDISAVTKDERKIGKAMNFAVLYGTSEYGLSYNLNIPVKRARELIMNFYSGYKTLAAFKRAFEHKVVKERRSVTLLGRVRYFPEFLDVGNINAYNSWESEVKRAGFNHLIQGTGADITKTAMVQLYTDNPFGHDSYRIILQVHDEIVVECREEIATKALEFTISTMKGAFAKFLRDVPAEVDASITKKWEKQ